MSMATLERAILVNAKAVLNNPKLRMKDIMEWRTSEIGPLEGETMIHIPDPGVYICVMKHMDKREIQS